MPRRGLFVLLLLYLIFAVGYSVLMPMWEGPDEPAHYLVAFRVARAGVFPVPAENYEAMQPRLYYWMASGVLRLLDRLDSGLVDFYRPYPYYRNVFQPIRIFNWTDYNYRILWAPQILRWLNGLLGALALICVYRAMCLLAPEKPDWALGTAAFVGLLPQFVHIATSIGNDSLAFLAGAFEFWLLARVTSGSIRGWVLLAVAPLAAAIPLLVKASVLPMTLVLLGAIAWRAISAGKRRTLALAGALGAGGVAGLLILAPEVPRGLWNEVLYRGLSLHPMAFQRAYILATTDRVMWSFWGKVGWLAVGLPHPLVLLLTAGLGLGLLGSLRLLLPLAAEAGLDAGRWATLALGAGVLAFAALSGWELAAGWGLLFALWFWSWGRKEDREAISRRTLAFLWAAAALAFIVVTKNGLTTSLNQGRFFLPTAGPIAALALAGLEAWLPDPSPGTLPRVVILFMTALNLILWIGGIVPVYYQPFLG